MATKTDPERETGREARGDYIPDDEQVLEAFHADSEFKMTWLENFYTLDKMLSTIETCDKDCKSCSPAAKNDCVLENKEMIHSIVLILKDMFSLLIDIDGIDVVVEKQDEQPHGMFS